LSVAETATWYGLPGGFVADGQWGGGTIGAVVVVVPSAVSAAGGVLVRASRPRATDTRGTVTMAERSRAAVTMRRLGGDGGRAVSLAPSIGLIVGPSYCWSEMSSLTWTLVLVWELGRPSRLSTCSAR
jgi:hypothetical protein